MLIIHEKMKTYCYRYNSYLIKRNRLSSILARASKDSYILANPTSNIEYKRRLPL
jgi:hypothetical protein